MALNQEELEERAALAEEDAEVEKKAEQSSNIVSILVIIGRITGFFRTSVQAWAIGALGLYVSNESVTDFQPMNVNFGIIPPLDHRVKGKRNKNAELSQRSLAILDTMKEEVLSL